MAWAAFRKISAVLCVLLFSISLPTYADDLWQVYQAALVNNPTFKKAWADWLAAREELPIALTGDGIPGSGLFPYATVSAFDGRAYDKTTIGETVTRNGHFGLGNYLLSATQPIFNYETWKNISRANYFAKSATATYLAASQQLMTTTAESYFTVLRDYNNVQIVHSKVRELKKLLGIATHRLNVGLVAITDVYDVKSRYYRSIVEEEAAVKELQRSIEALKAVTGIKYISLRDLRHAIPLIVPKPQRQSAWVHVAENHNYVIHADLYAMLSAHERVKQVAAEGYPTLNAKVDFDVLDEGTMRGGLPHNKRLINFNAVGLQVNFPFLQGGHVITATRQAEYQYLSASDQLQFTRYEVRRTTSQAYISINQDIKQIQSGYKAIIASRQALHASQVSYLVGERSMLDVVIDVQTLYDAMLVWNNDRNNYVINLVVLKQQAGTLSPIDLFRLNRWLGVDVSLSKKAGLSVVNHFKIVNKLERMLLEDQSKLRRLKQEYRESQQNMNNSTSNKPNVRINNFIPIRTISPVHLKIELPQPKDEKRLMSRKHKNIKVIKKSSILRNKEAHNNRVLSKKHQHHPLKQSNSSRNQSVTHKVKIKNNKHVHVTLKLPKPNSEAGLIIKPSKKVRVSKKLKRLKNKLTHKNTVSARKNQLHNVKKLKSTKNHRGPHKLKITHKKLALSKMLRSRHLTFKLPKPGTEKKGLFN